jgi:trehalose 6-phosphate phosphatase
MQTNAALVQPSIPALQDCALLLDIDGTLLDIAPTPTEVIVPPTLPPTLSRLSELTTGAIAFVSGRRLSEIDFLFAPLKFAAVGGHGAQIRPLEGPVRTGPAEPLDPALKRRLASIAALEPGLIAEDKGFSLALHFRQAPEKEDFVRAAVARICATETGVEILRGKSVVEVKSAGFSKATAVRELMTTAPFTGRRPIFIGDDTTDEIVFPIIPGLNGVAFSVGRRIAGVAGYFESPDRVRRWLAEIADRADKR